jgi:DNA-binding beta-propeller fold protein YncE
MAVARMTVTGSTTVATAYRCVAVDAVPFPGGRRHRTATRPGPVSAVLLACVVVALCGCTGPKVAEPGTAPTVAVAPAGRVVHVGGQQAEGIVADPVTHLVAVGVRNPTGLVLVDGHTGQVTVRVPLPGALRHLQLAAPAGPVLVPDEDAGALLTVALPAGTVLTRVPVGRTPHDATATTDGTIGVADEQGKALVLVRDGRVVHRFTDLAQPGGVAAVGDLTAPIDVHDHTLAGYDAARLTRTAVVPAGDGPTHLVADRRGRLLVVDTAGNRLRTFTIAPLRQVDEMPLPGTPYGIAYDPARDRLWVTLTARNQLVGFDLTGTGPREIERLPTVGQPNTVAVDSATGRVFMASRADGSLQLIDPGA